MPKYTPKPIGCLGCPAYEYGIGFVEHTGSLDSPIALVGQGPGEQEAAFSTPFYPMAPSGSMLDRWLNKAGKSRTQTIVANVVQCWLPKSKSKTGRGTGNRMPTTAEISHCWHAHVGPMLHASSAKFIIPIGAPATKWFLDIDSSTEKYTGTFTKLDLRELSNDRDKRTNSAGERTSPPRPALEGHDEPVHNNVSDNHINQPRANRNKPGLGETRTSNSEANAELQPIELSELQETIVGAEDNNEVSLLQRSANSVKPRWIMPLTHPAAIVRGQWHLAPVQETYLARALTYAFSDTEPALQNPMLPPPNTKLYPTLSEMYLFVEEASDAGAYALDIEEAGEHIICVGMTAINLETNQLGTTVCLRFRKQGGGLYWQDYEDHTEAVRVVQQLLLLPVPKIFQNGITFDVPELAALGFKICGPYIDTMHLAHTAYPELPKSLQFLATLYLGSPVWKTLVDSEELEGKG